jgi:RND family efflux transporter MFP subunit
MQKFKIILPIIVLLAGMMGTYALIATKPVLEPEKPSDTIPVVTVIKAEPQTVTLNVTSQGVVKPRHELDLSAEVSGKVLYLHPQFVTGGFFHKDEVLLKIDARVYDAAIVQAQAQIAEAKRLLATEQAQAEQAHTEWQALGKGKPTTLAMREPQLAEARAKLKSAESALLQAQLQREYCEIRAAFSGRFASKNVALGQIIQAGEKLAHVYATDSAEIRLPVSLEQLAFLDISLNGQAQKPLKVTLSAPLASQQASWSAQIIRTEGAVDESTGVIYLVAEVKQPYQSAQPLLNGLFVHAEIQGKALNDIFVLPQQAVNSSQTAFIVDKEQKLRSRHLEVLRTEPERVLVQQGLNAGERVITSGIDLPIEGMSVQVEDSKQ